VSLADLGSAGNKFKHAMMQGTPGFIAPEQQCQSERRQGLRLKLARVAARMGIKRDHSAVDVWQLAVTWLHMVCPAGKAEDVDRFVEQLASKRRWQRKPQAPSWVPKELHSLLLDCMLVKSPKRRWSVQQLKSHPFFSGVDWEAVQAQRVPLSVDLVALAAVGRRYYQDA